MGDTDEYSYICDYSVNWSDQWSIAVKLDYQGLSIENIDRVGRERIVCAEFLSKIYANKELSKNDNITMVGGSGLKIHCKVLSALYSLKLNDIISRQVRW